MSDSNNPLTNFYRAPKLYLTLPSNFKFYNNDEVEVPESGEVAVFSMTAKDEMAMKNPDALLNGEAVCQVISSCVPAVKKPRKLVSNDIDALLVAIQSASYGDEVTVSSTCPECNASVSGTASIEAALENMTIVEESYSFETHNGLEIEIRPFSYESTIKAGIANFRSTRTLQSLANIEDELEQLKMFTESFEEFALLNFDLLVDSVSKIKGKTPDGEDFVVTNRDNIREFLENCDSNIGKMIDEKVGDINAIGIQKKMMLECEECDHQFEEEIGFDPVNFFIASSLEQNQKK